MIVIGDQIMQVSMKQNEGTKVFFTWRLQRGKEICDKEIFINKRFC